LETSAAFGHLFSNYQVGALDRDSIQDAAEKSNAEYAYFDRKSLRSPDKKKIAQVLADLGIELLREKEINGRFPGPSES
ncbi:MAG: D-tyrosyl-tRNA(Tyr) deacylase, partial [Methanosarcinales archaeon]|nr:D-tyrosyl-tRNA(Tyr) deacylase [Methanosarcinales archaeon]